MPFGVGVLTVAFLAVWIYCVLDVISTPEGAHRNLPKLGWLVLVLLLPVVGSVAWILGGRPRRHPGGFGGAAGPGSGSRGRPRPRPRPRGPDDDPDFLRGL